MPRHPHDDLKCFRSIESALAPGADSPSCEFLQRQAFKIAASKIIRRSHCRSQFSDLLADAQNRFYAIDLSA